MKIFFTPKKKSPQIGEIRIRNRFVFYKRIGNEIRILEKASWKEELKHCYFHVKGMKHPIDSSEWRAVEWIND